MFNSFSLGGGCRRRIAHEGKLSYIFLATQTFANNIHSSTKEFVSYVLYILMSVIVLVSLLLWIFLKIGFEVIKVALACSNNWLIFVSWFRLNFISLLANIKAPASILLCFRTLVILFNNLILIANSVLFVLSFIIVFACSYVKAAFDLITLFP